MPALARGVPCAIVSIGALSEEGLVEALSDAASQGATQVHLLSGAIGAMDALASATLRGKPTWPQPPTTVICIE